MKRFIKGYKAVICVDMFTWYSISCQAQSMLRYVKTAENGEEEIRESYLLFAVITQDEWECIK